VITLLTIPAGASAAQTATSTVVSGGVGTATAQCPKGSRATGGGFRFPSFSLSNAAVYENRKVGKRRWRASVASNGGPDFALTTIVYCSKSASSTKQRQSTVTFFGFSGALAECDTGERARAGGFVANADVFSSGFFINSSIRSNPDEWQATNGVPSPASVRAIAYCAKGGTPRSRSGSVNTSASGTDLTALSATCPKGTKPGAGGFAQNSNFASFVFVNESFRVGKAWQTSGFKPNGNPTTLTSVAYCS
jgi:hypothetical protein